jgi:hypothetical protein
MINSLPHELHEQLLKSCACLLAKTLLTTDSRPDVETFVTLASVCRYFCNILTTRKWFTRTFQQYLWVVCHPYRPRPLLLTTFDYPLCNSVHGPVHRAVQGLTTLDNKLFVVYNKSATICVYSAQTPYTQLTNDNIHIYGLKNPQDIAACSNNSCLYVADGLGKATGGCVWKVKTDHKVDKWLEGVEWVQSLAVMSEGHLIMLIKSEPDRVDVYNSDRVKLSSLQLPRDIEQPQHVVQTVNKSFIVCHGPYRDTGLHRVCEVNEEGVIVKSYGGSCGSELGQLSVPVYIARDTKDQVFVADSNSGRVLLLDRQLNIQRVLLTWSRDRRPYRLVFDRTTTQLMVGFVSGQVEIFSLL